MNKKVLMRVLSVGIAASLIMTPVSEFVAFAEETDKEETQEGNQEENQEEETNEAAAKEVITIRTVKDLAEFAENCNTDAWSVNKRIELQEDISLEGVDFEPIPIFAGTFDGNGHTISGFYYMGSGYADGFFRYITQTGIVQDLTILGKVQAENEEECTGGICGVNGGWILNCSFRGKVEGKSETGGIAGENENSGTISSCQVYGTVTGYDRAGGIAGANYGAIRNCMNRAGINSDSSWLEEKDDAGLEWLMEDLSERKLVSGTDIGGIAGYSKGILSNCTNTGIVGYEHNGYNIGGIVGRQAGQVVSCSNSGNVYGRKDVGGIVGQMEPYISVEEAESVSEAVNRLHDMVDKFLDDAGNTQDAVSADFDKMRAHSDKALSDADSIAGQTTDFIDKNIDTVNELADRIGYILERLPYVIDDVDGAIDGMSKTAEDLRKVVNALKIDGNVGNDTYDETKRARLSLVSGVGGNVYADKAAPAEGETVKITVTPEEGYQLSYISVTDADKNMLSLTEAASEHTGSYAYTFVMSKKNAVVKAEFSYKAADASNAPGDAAASNQSDAADMQKVSAKLSTTDIQKVSLRLDTREVQKVSAKLYTTDSQNGMVKLSTADIPNITGEPDTEDVQEVSDEADASDGQNASDESEVEDVHDAPAEPDAEDVQEVSDEADASDGQNTSNGSDESEKPDEPDKADGDDTPNMTDVSGVKIILESNAGGKADYTLSGNIVTLTVRPNAGYKLNGNPAVTDDTGNRIPLSKKSAASYVYEFEITGAMKQVKVMITFMAGTDSDTVDNSWDGLEENVNLLQTQMQNISDIMTKINKLLDGKDIKDLTEADMNQLMDYLLDLAQALSDAATTLSNILGDLTSIANIEIPYVKKALKEAGVEMNHVIDDLKNVFSHLDSAFGLLRSTVLYLNGKFDIQFAKLGDGMSAAVGSLFDELDVISSYAAQINHDIDAHSDILESDLHNINDQVNIIFQLFTERIENVEELYYDEKGYEDISDEDIDGSTEGKVERAVNSGIVKGDINVGGVAGSMAIDEEDPEGNAAGSVNRSFGSRYLTKCIISRCENNGQITAKKDGAGGIVGYMNLGIVTDSEAYGNIESTEGEYIGGISGESRALIKNSWSLASLNGSGHIGGIAGLGTRIQDCHAMVMINDGAVRKGAIAGWVEVKEDERVGFSEDIRNNFFVSSALCGIDEVSYLGVAEPVTYEEMLAMEGIPSQFGHLQLTFIADDKVVSRMEVKYGQPLSELDFPDAPASAGLYGVWPDVSDMTMEGNITLEAEYYDNITTLPSVERIIAAGERDETQLNQPYAYIDGVYTDSSVLSVSVTKQTMQETKADINKKAESTIYDISVSDEGLSEDAISKVRLYNPYGKIKMVLERVDGQWQEIDYKEYGKYIQVDMIGSASAYYIISGDKSYGWIPYVGVGAAVLILLVIAARCRTRFTKPHTNT